MPDLREGHRGAGPDRLRPEHVVVDDVRPNLGQVGGQGAHGDRVVRLVDDQDVETGLLELAGGAARRERHDGHVVPFVVHPSDEGVEVLLGATIGPRREHLDDADAPAAQQGRTFHDLQARVEGTGGTHISLFV